LTSKKKALTTSIVKNAQLNKKSRKTGKNRGCQAKKALTTYDNLVIVFSCY